MQRLAKLTSNEIADWRARRGRVSARADAPTLRPASKETVLMFLMGLGGAIFLLAGLALIWRFTPASADPLAAQSAANSQNAYIIWVANNYSQKKNLAQAQQQLSGWKTEDLASYLPILIQETSDAETRRRLTALRDALKLPAPQTAYPPAQWTDDYKKLFIIYVASKYWLTGDKTFAQSSFTDWNQDDLAKQLLDLARQTQDAETRRNLVVLTDALRLPITQTSLALFILNQPGVLLGALLAAMPLLALTTTVSLPRLRKLRRSILKRIGIATAQMLAEEQAEKQRAAKLAKPLEESLDEMLAEAQSEQAIGAPGAEQTEEENKAKAEEEEKTGAGGFSDLASLFEEEDTSLNELEEFVKGMAEVSIDALLALSQNVIAHLRQGVRKEPSNQEKTA